MRIVALILVLAFAVAFTVAAKAQQQYNSEGNAMSHCSGQIVVWMNVPSKIYHYAGSRDFGTTKSGGYMCLSDADKMGRAAKNEKAPPSK